ncbi:MAG: acetylxylan esterase [Planctomycetes bacterium]|nr:acetylxylan esterase [Planctomycetota bacterium]
MFNAAVRSRILLLLILSVTPLRAGGPGEKDLADRLRELDDKALATDADKAKRFPQMLSSDVRARIRTANRRESEAWQVIEDRAGWERFMKPRIAALRDSLGGLPRAAQDVKVRVCATLTGDGYRIENIVFESRPGLWVTANLYAPTKPGRAMPGILLCHSHHAPKTQGELQDMGMTWARLGCVVLVMDQLGHGERRQHPFVEEKSFPKPFRVSRQDYYFRGTVGLQLHLVGESQIGWMVHDLVRGVDVLLARPGVDRDKILLLGAVAGGGDPASVAAALDRRIAAVVPFNFGGPQPETTYPLPADADAAFNYAGSGSWESTRNLRLSARDGFLPWVIVGSVAPRRLDYAHEFSWDRERDPVWKRLQKIYGFYDVADRLASVHGRGKVSGTPPESTHCTNIGPVHRKQIDPALKQWFDIPIPGKEYLSRRTVKELTCLTPELAREIKPRSVSELARDLAHQRMEAARKKRAELKPDERRQQLREDWARLLGDVKPHGPAKVVSRDVQKVGGVSLERILLEVEPGIHVPLLLLLPAHEDGTRLPVAVGVAQEGKAAFLKQRADVLAELLEKGTAVCLADVRGTGETRPGSGRGRTSAATAIAASELMLGQTLVGSRLRDLRSVLAHLRKRTDIDSKRMLLWGDSFARENAAGAVVAVPAEVEPQPRLAEPLGAFLALFGGLFEEEVRAVCARGGLLGYEALLRGPFVHIPPDAIVPGALTAGDLSDVVEAITASRWLEGLVDGVNRRVPPAEVERTFRAAIKKAGKGDAGSLQLRDEVSNQELAHWMGQALAGK